MYNGAHSANAPVTNETHVKAAEDSIKLLLHHKTALLYCSHTQPKVPNLKGSRAYSQHNSRLFQEIKTISRPLIHNLTTHHTIKVVGSRANATHFSSVCRLFIHFHVSDFPTFQAFFSFSETIQGLFLSVLKFKVISRPASISRPTWEPRI